MLTKADDLYRHVPLGESDALLPVCSGNMLFNLFDEYMDFWMNRHREMAIKKRTNC